MGYYLKGNNEYVKSILDKKRNELTKIVKEVIGLAFQKGELATYQIDIFMFNGSFSAEIKENREDKEVCKIDYIDIECKLFTTDFEAVISDYERKIADIKEFILKIKKLK